MIEKKMSKDEFWDEMDPDKLNLSKDDLLRFCHECIDEWKKNSISNLKYIIPMEIMIVQVKATPETVLKAFWKKIMFWMYDLTYKNAIANTKDTMMKELRKIGQQKDT
jgi:hypothetical protein|tara:strand:+ start:493 stop:816 length:324 start_codon:yes stop_codon:yes gene_type:complete